MSVLHDFIVTKNDIEGLRELLKGGENPNSQDRSGHTPLHIAILQSQRYPQETDDLLPVVHELIYYGANVDARNNYGKTPLHFAVASRNCKMIETLLLYNAQINQIDNAGDAVLHFATTKRGFRGHVAYDLFPAVVELLLKYDPEIDIRSRNNETALMLAVQNNNLYIVRELLNNKASANLRDSDGDSAMHYALKRREVNVNIVLELIRHRCSFTLTNNSHLRPMTLYYWALLGAPLTEVEKAKFVLKLYVIRGNKFDSDQKEYIREISQVSGCKLIKFIRLCRREIREMRRHSLYIYYIAKKGAVFSVAENINHFPHEVFDDVLCKLIKREYPIYCDLIAAGICSPYMNHKFAELCSSVEICNKFLNDGLLYSLSLYLSHFDMLNMMIACSGDWGPFCYLPRFIHNTRCSVS